MKLNLQDFQAVTVNILLMDCFCILCLTTSEVVLVPCLCASHGKTWRSYV